MTMNVGMEQESTLAGQVALVTGGGRGIGRAIAEKLAASGAKVAVLARSRDQVAETVALITAAQGEAQGFAADVTDLTTVQAAVREIEEGWGGIDLLVNNAAVTGQSGPSWEVDPDDWWRCQEINLRGPFLCAKAVLPGMVGRRRGRIVNVASGAGLGAMTHASGYGVSKTALIRWSEILATETAPHGIVVFAIDPGDVITAMSTHIMSDEMSEWLPWVHEHFAKHAVPASQAADLVHWLAAGKGDALSGRYLSIRYDVEEMAARAKEIGEKGLYTLRLRV